MKAIDFIKKVKSESITLPVYYIAVFTYEDGKHASPDYRDKETREEVYFGHDEACEAVDKVASEQVPDFGERIEVTLMKAEVKPGDIDWNDIEEWADYDFGDSELHDMIDERCYEEPDDYVKVVSYDYRSVEDDLLVFWHWDRYVGYARDIEDIRRGYHGETTELCIPIDHTFRTQCSILATKDELEGLSAEELKDLVEDRLHDHCGCEYTQGDWKWTMKAEAYIRRYIRENFEKVWSDMGSDEQELNVRQMNDTYNFATDYEDAKAAAAAVRVAYENDPAWFGFVVDDLDEFEQDIEENVDYLYFKTNGGQEYEYE